MIAQPRPLDHVIEILRIQLDPRLENVGTPPADVIGKGRVGDPAVELFPQLLARFRRRF